MKQPESKTMTIYGLRSEPVAALTRNLPKDVEQFTAQKNGDYWQITYPKKAIKK